MSVIGRVGGATFVALPVLGIARAATDLGITTQARCDAERESPHGMADVGLALSRTSAHRRAVVQELIGFASSTPGGTPPPLGDLPLTVLTVSQPPVGSPFEGG